MFDQKSKAEVHKKNNFSIEMRAKKEHDGIYTMISHRDMQYDDLDFI